MLASLRSELVRVDGSHVPVPVPARLRAGISLEGLVFAYPGADEARTSS